MHLSDISATTWWYLAGGLALVVVGLLVYGFRDLKRLSVGRIWAVSGVVFRESVRRRALWVTPLAMLAVLLLVRLQVPVDEQDAIRQAIKFCLFASGLVVIAISLILSATNLPREIESRVIFTLTTKPLTRLELLAGKVVGFARLSALILLIMGGFSWALLAAMDMQLRGQIRQTLSSPLAEETRRPFLEHLASHGLLRAQRTGQVEDVQIYAMEPEDRSDGFAGPRWFHHRFYYAAVPFELNPQDLEDAWGDGSRGVPRLRVDLRAHWQQLPGALLLPGDPPMGIVNLETLPPPLAPWVRVQMRDGLLYNVVSVTAIQENPRQLPQSPDVPWEEAPSIRLSADHTLRVYERLADDGKMHVAIYGMLPEYMYGVAADSVRLVLEDGMGEEMVRYTPAIGDKPRNHILLRTELGSVGLGVSGPDEDVPAPWAVLAFRNQPQPLVDDGHVHFETSFYVERVGGILDDAAITEVEVRVVNTRTGFKSPPQRVYPETGRTVMFRVPAEAVEGGDFDVQIQTLSEGHVVGVRGADIGYLVADWPFVVNLAMALAVQWLLSVLVIVCGLCFSTFVSWPIAVVLTMMVLSGRWLARQLGDAMEGEALGRRVAQEMFAGDAGAAGVALTAAHHLDRLFHTVTAFLPEMTFFNVGEYVEQGMLLHWSQLGWSAGVTVAFALPLATLAYIMLRNKEVAP